MRTDGQTGWLTGRQTDRQAGKQTNRESDMTKLTATLRNLLKVPKYVKPI